MRGPKPGGSAAVQAAPEGRRSQAVPSSGGQVALRALLVATAGVRIGKQARAEQSMQRLPVANEAQLRDMLNALAGIRSNQRKILRRAVAGLRESLQSTSKVRRNLHETPKIIHVHVTLRLRATLNRP